MSARTRRVELILRQVESLPTLPAVATRLLALTTSEQSDARQVIDLIRSDPAMTAKVLTICRRADLGIRDQGLTIDKAVVLLGFAAVRNTVLSLEIYDMFDLPQSVRTDQSLVADAVGGGTPGGDKPVMFDRRGLWRHSLAVAIAAERIALAHKDLGDFEPGFAFVGGLLHDIGKLALDHVLPKSMARVAELAEVNQGNIAEFERRIVGIDHHTAGKRLAEQWRLPYILQDCIWLHGCAFDLLPRLDHRRMVGLISLADLIARRRHLGYSGNFVFSVDPMRLARDLGLDPVRVENATRNLHEELERRCTELGLDEQPSRDLFVQSIQQANRMLGRLNSALERRARLASRQAQLLEAITTFNAVATPGRSVEDVLAAVVSSAASSLGQGYYAMLYQGATDEPWLVAQYDGEGRSLHSQIIEPPPRAPDLATLDAAQPAALNLMSILPWVADYLADSKDVREIRLLPLGCGWGTAAILLHDRPTLPVWRDLQALATTWGGAIAAAGQHDGARRLGEELAEANRALAETQDRLLHNESMARLGEMAAGAAHEMNNPLAVISGRAQLLMQAASAGSKEHQAAQTIIQQSQHLSDLITSLRLFSDPPRPNPTPTDLPRLLEKTIKHVQAEYADKLHLKPINVQVSGRPQVLPLDPDHVSRALTEVLLNALQAQPKTCVHVTAKVRAPQKQLVIEVSDDGVGMDAYTLEHAMDPFFSAKSAGRRMGMGLPRARQLAGAHGGSIELRSTLDRGTVVTLNFGLEALGQSAAA